MACADLGQRAGSTHAHAGVPARVREVKQRRVIDRVLVPADMLPLRLGTPRIGNDAPFTP